MGLFDRLFGRKKEETSATEEVLSQEISNENLADSENLEVVEMEERNDFPETTLEADLSSSNADLETSIQASSESNVDLETSIQASSESNTNLETSIQASSESNANLEMSAQTPFELASERENSSHQEVPSDQPASALEAYYADLQARLAAAHDKAKEEAGLDTSVENTFEPELVEQEKSTDAPVAEVAKPELFEDESTSVENTFEPEPVEQEKSADALVAETAKSEQFEEESTSKTPEFQTQPETVQDKYDRSLRKTRKGFGAKLNAFFANFRKVDEEFFEELEELLITSDVGVQVASRLTEELRYEARLENAKKPDALRQVIIEKLVDLYEKDGTYKETIQLKDDLTVMLFVGVNGVGKTTSIGKLAYKYKNEGKKVMLVAADTFRAGAVAQLVEWGNRVGVPVVTGPEKSDPASVVYDGMERAKAEQVDILLIDTAGRLQNKDNLMAELEKIGRIIKRVDETAPHETFLALDASTGQNALVQVKEFSKITPLTGIVLTKIDGTARGGVVLAIREELDIPVKLIGFGEKIDDIGEFNSEHFMKGLLEGLL
ncbi:signal recognition particle-docking protein FtsY [Streptococcus himalayensis]|uniref:Signal recognition particle receptor FtsY n=1 Tax=Streptococcus himalayensis TaxID=1888195 RepID=A0A917A555_9STRE|nr:signal recognition particle-docking protein FtsY [Streptococcus himalayensis]GGE27454.1 signal recognition particle receptor FtsY [Streptococcus himalayensis]